MLELYVVGGERFLAWIGLMMISLCYYNIGKLVSQLEFKIPSYGVAIESASWSVHQMGWWYWHMMRAALEKFESNTTVQTAEYDLAVSAAKDALSSATLIADRIATVAYIGTAVGAVMIMYPFLSRHFPTYWWLVGAGGMLTVFGVGVLITTIWVA